MRPGAVPLVIHLGQYDSDFTLVFELYSSAGNFTVESGTTAMIRGTKTDGNAYDADATIDVSAKTVTVAGNEQMTAAKGRNVYELVLTKSGKVLSTANFILDVERAAMDADTIASESVLKELNAIIAGAATATEAAQTATAAAESVSGSAAQIATNTADISDLKADLNTGYLTIHHDIAWESGWVRNNGNVEASSGASTYCVVPVGKGEIVEIGTNNANMTIIGSTTAETVSVGDTVTVIQATGSSGSYETHVYEAPEDMTLVLCVRASNYSLKFTKQAEVLANIEDFVASSLNNLTVSSDMIDGNTTKKKKITSLSEKDNYFYFRSTSSTLSSTVGSASIGVIIPLTEFVSDDILFDWDASLNQSQQPIMLAVGNTEGTTINGYFSTYEIVNAGQSFQTYGGVYDSVNKQVHLSLSEITTRKPDARYLVLSLNKANAHGVYTFVPQERKQLKWLIAGGAVPAIVVASDGTGDYISISEAVSAASNGDTIYIKDGEYKETVVINKYVHLVGQSKQNTVLYQDIGDYNNCPLLITQGSVCNMTIKSLAPADASGLSNYAYAVHLDRKFASLAKYQKCEIYNCDIYSEVNDAIGAGTNYASEYDIHDCFLHVAHNPVKAGACGFKCHNGQNQTAGKVTLRNNVIITEDANGTSCYDILFHNGGISNTQPINILQVGNVLKYYHNRITNIFVPSGYNFGNSVAEMNTLS